jgi:hypothetical protein
VVAPDVQGPTIYGHNGTAAAETVAAVRYNTTSAVEQFSSRGPVTHLFAPVNGVIPAPALATPKVLSKPDIAATDGGRNTFFGSGCPTCRFFGTSAAAPHAAGIAALQLEADPAATVNQVKGAQETGADPVGAFGPFEAGAGLLDAPDAIGLTLSPPAPPTVTLGSGAGARTADTTPTVQFSVAGRPRSVTCSLDGGPPVACASQFTPAAPLADGSHTLRVSASDYYERSDSAVATFVVDTTGPAVKITKGPRAKTAKRTAKFKFRTEAGAKTKCKLDRGRYAKCSSPAKFKVKPGGHRLRIQGIDALGNNGRPASYRWKVKR